MNAEEYANLDSVEREHWYYAGKREMVRRWLAEYGPPRAEHLLLDCGAGTGRFAKEMESLCRVLVLDDHEAALRFLRQRFRPDQILSLAGDRVPLRDASVDFLTALDVLEHVPDDAAVVRGFHRILKSDGLLVVTVPASMALWGDWDEALHHYRRYNRSQLCGLFAADHWDVLHVNYTNVIVYPIVWLVRKWRRLRAGKPGKKRNRILRSEDRIPSPWLNRVLHRTFVRLGSSRIPFPFGVSLVLVARRRA